ncbi:MAG: tol-pal system YbgF family protein [Fidelibacterota bacterium]
MRTIIKIILAGVFVSLIAGQDMYHSLDEIKKEWKDYTKFQRGELLNFCNFLYDAGYYDRAVVSLYQFLYRFPGDRMENIIYYKLGRSLEKTGKWVEARRYFQDLLSRLDSNSVAFRATQYHDLYLQYRLADYEGLLNRLNGSSDPYHLLMMGYTNMATGDYSRARIAFLTAEEVLDDTYYINRIDPIVDLIDSVQVVPRKKRMLSFFSSLIPGGGKAYLSDWESAAGILATSILSLWILPKVSSGQLGLTLMYPVQDIVPEAKFLKKGEPFTVSRDHYPSAIISGTSGRKYWVGPISIALVLYGTSIWNAVSVVGEVNRQAIDRYVQGWIESYPLQQFMDFPEPELDKNK